MRPREEPIPEGSRKSGSRTETHATVLSLAAVASMVAASSCCLPLLPFLMAAGFAGSSAFLSAARPYLMVVSILLVAYGFYQARRARQCEGRPSVLASALLWASAVFVLLSILFPQVLSNAAASILAR